MSESTLLPRPMYIEEFLPLKGQTFEADCDPRSVPLVLSDILPAIQSAGVARQSFILLFTSAPDALLVPGMYRMKTKGFGPEIIYIERTTPPNAANSFDGYYYQAVFN